MGSTQGKAENPESQLVNILRQYRVLQEKSNEHITVLENMYNPSLIVELRHLKYTTEQDFSQKLRKLEKVKTISHPCILKIIGIHSDKLDQFCSTIYQISIITERPQQNLFEYLLSRGQSDFSETELWFFIDCIVSAQAQLQKLLRPTKSLSFREILMCPVIQQQTGVGQIWKLAPDELDFDEYFYVTIYERYRLNLAPIPEEQKEFHLYPSPEEMKLLQAKATQPSGDLVKSSVFTLGMLILHLAQGEACDGLYDTDHLELSKDQLQERLNELTDKFSQQFCDLMNNILIIDATNRPDYIQLDSRLNQYQVLQGKRVQDRASAYSGPVMIHQTSKPLITSNQIPMKQVPSKFSSPQQNNFMSQDIYGQQFQSLNNQDQQQNMQQNFQYKQQPQQQIEYQSQAQQQSQNANQQQNTFQDQYQVQSQLPIQQEFATRDLYQSNRDNQIIVTESYQNGSRFTGEKVNGLRQGKGRMDFAEGGFYEGQWKENTMCGKGQLYYDNGQKAFDGEFRDGKFHNFGHLWNKKPIKENRPFDYKIFKQLGDLWQKYEGDFQDDRKHGFGVLQLTNGEVYTGSFKDDLIHGYGAFKKLDGLTINGYWEYSMLTRIV